MVVGVQGSGCRSLHIMCRRKVRCDQACPRGVLGTRRGTVEMRVIKFTIAADWPAAQWRNRKRSQHHCWAPGTA